MAEEKSPATAEEPKSSFTGIKRERKTKRSVLIADVASKWIITVGGLGTILSVLAVAVFLIYVVLPLFLPAKVDSLRAIDEIRDELVHVALDEYQILTWTLSKEGKIQVYRLDNGEKRWEHQLFPPGEMMSASFLVDNDTAAFGLADGSVQLVDIGFKTTILDAPDVDPEVLAAIEGGATLVNKGDGVVEPTPAGQYRRQELEVEMGDKVRVSQGPVLKVDHVVAAGGPFALAIASGGPPLPEVAADEASDFASQTSAETADSEAVADESAEPADLEAETIVAEAAVDASDLQLLAVAWDEDTNFLTGETTKSAREPAELPFDVETAPDFIEIGGAANQAYLVWRDGRLTRLYFRSLDEPRVAEEGRLLPSGSTAELLFFDPILGANTFLWGDS